MVTRRTEIQSPKREGKYPDRNIDCQQAVACGVVDLIEEAEKSGWSAMEAARAIQDVARGLFIGHSGKERHE